MKYMVVDIKDFYLNTDIERYEYMKLRIDIIFEEIVVQYCLREVKKDGYVYMDIRKGMCGLP